MIKMYERKYAVIIASEVPHNSKEGAAFYTAVSYINNIFKDLPNSNIQGLEIEVSPPNENSAIDVSFKKGGGPVRSEYLKRLEKWYKSNINYQYDFLLRNGRD